MMPNHRPLISVRHVWIGDPGQGRELLPTLRDVLPPVAERVEELSYRELQRFDDPPQRHLVRRYTGAIIFAPLGGEAIDPTFLPSGSPRSYGEAIASLDRDATAFSHRYTLVEFGASARWADPAEDEARIAGVRRYGAAGERLAGGVYANDCCRVH